MFWGQKLFRNLFEWPQRLDFRLEEGVLTWKSLQCRNKDRKQRP